MDLDAYLEKISVLKKIYKDKIDVRIGVEQGLQPHLCEQINNYDPAHRLDFIIGSTHLVDGSDPYYPSFWEHHSPKESICTYFENIYKSICCCDNFDVYGHLDYVVRYAPKKDADYQPADYTDLLDMILKKLIENGKGIEINTAGLRYGLKEANPCCFILKRYRELGGEILTTGSDAHKPQDMAFAFDIIVDLLKDCGFSYYTLFHQRSLNLSAFKIFSQKVLVILGLFPQLGNIIFQAIHNIINFLAGDFFINGKTDCCET